MCIIDVFTGLDQIRAQNVLRKWSITIVWSILFYILGLSCHLRTLNWSLNGPPKTFKRICGVWKHLLRLRWKVAFYQHFYCTHPFLAFLWTSRHQNEFLLILVISYVPDIWYKHFLWMQYHLWRWLKFILDPVWVTLCFPTLRSMRLRSFTSTKLSYLHADPLPPPKIVWINFGLHVSSIRVYGRAFLVIFVPCLAQWFQNFQI